MKGVSSALKPFPQWVPEEVVEGYAEKGVCGLFEWQEKVLDEASTSTGNVVYSAPTSAGKSLVAELLALKTASSDYKVLFILPYISVAREKFIHLQKLWRRVDLQVAGYMGHHSAQARDWMCAVCTIEKANSLVNKLIEHEELEKIGLIIIDELHMVSDGSRGATVESFAAKLRYCQSTVPTLRILGMSATLGNKEKVERWLGCTVHETDFRPIHLTETIAVEGQIMSMSSMETVRKLSSQFVYVGDPDRSVGLALESMASGALTLIFCSSKNETEKTAKEIAKVLQKVLPAHKEFQKQVDRQALLGLKVELERLGPVDPMLRSTLPWGVGFHHAGLTTDEREIVENAFQRGTVRILVATSTLSSGVNLPANRVIIRAQTRGPAAINQTTYRQMAGRAGRMGHVETGESILVVKNGEVDVVRRLITEPPDRGNDVYRDPGKVVLEAICSRLCSTLEDVHRLIDCMLYSTTRDAEQTVQDLVALKLIAKELDADGTWTITPTQLGSATLASSLPPQAALFVFEDLRRASKAVCIETELHMLYLVTPINISVFTGVDWNRLHTIFIKLPDEDKRVSRLIGVQEAVILACIQGRHVENNKMQLVHRFFCALSLYDVVNEVPLTEVAAKFGVTRGALQSLQLQSATYASMIVAFSSRLGWFYLKSLLEGFASRLAFGVRRELTELVRLPGVDGARARAFHEAGITSLGQLANGEPRTVAAVLTSIVPFESSADNDGLGEWLFGEARMRLEDAVEELMRRADLAVTEQIRNMGLLAESQIESIRRKKEVDISQRVDEKRGEIREEEQMATQRMATQRQEAEFSEDESEDIQNEDPLVTHMNDATPYFQRETSLPDSCDSGIASGNCTLVRMGSQETDSPSSSHPLNGTADTSVDMFSQSIADLSLEDVITAASEERRQSVNKQRRQTVRKEERVPDESVQQTARKEEGELHHTQAEAIGEIDDLETNFKGEAYTQIVAVQASTSNNDYEDSFDIEPVYVGNVVPKQPSQQCDAVEDSFDIDATFTPVERKVEEKENFIDSFDISVSGYSNAKRLSLSKEQNRVLRRSLLLRRSAQFVPSPLAEKNPPTPGSLHSINSASSPRENVEDSFYFTFTTPKRVDQEGSSTTLTKLRQLENENVEEEDREIDRSADLFGTSMSSVDASPVGKSGTPVGGVRGSHEREREKSRDTVSRPSPLQIQHKANKRVRSNLAYPHSPTTASPTAKIVRRTEEMRERGERRESEDIGEKTENEPTVVDSCSIALRRAETVTELYVNDVCRCESAWLEFEHSASTWDQCALGVATKRVGGREFLSGVSLCSIDGSPQWIPLCDDDFYGNNEEEEMVPSCTPSDEIPIEERLRVVAEIFRECPRVYVFDAMRVCSLLRETADGLGVRNPLDVSYLAFLAMMRNGDRSLPLADVLQKCKFTLPINQYLHSTTRIRAAMCALVLPMAFWQIRPVAERETSERSVELELNSMAVAVRMMCRGVHFDREECAVKQTELRHRLEEISEECAKYAGKEVDVGSSKDVANLLFTRLKLPYPGSSNTVSRSTSKETLQQLVDKHPLPAKIIEYRRIQFSISNHIRPLRDCVSSSGTLHPFLDLFTSTGRLISTHPNVQNVTKEELISGFGVRHLFVARKDHLFISADYSQLELRVMAHLSGDPKLCDLFRESGRDIFTDMAKEMGYDRNAVKTLCYGIIYGMGARSLSQLLNCPQKKASELISTFFRTYPKVQSYIANVKERAATAKCVETVLGRKRITSCTVGRQDEKAKDDRQSVNFTIQGTASEIFKSALMKLEEALKEVDGYIVLPVHDEVICEVPEKYSARAQSIISSTLQSAFPSLSVPLPVKTASGRNWAELQK